MDYLTGAQSAPAVKYLLRVIAVCGVLAASSAGAAQAADPHQHDFDFEWGSWKAHLRLLPHRFAGSHAWIDYYGTLVVHKLWAGKANISELEVSNANSRIEGGALHLYNPQTHQWSVAFASSDSGVLGVPNVGRFEHGRGVFYDRELYHGRSIVDRWLFTNISRHTFDFEQAFSTDNGATWETNLVINYTR
jgi:hypothetical protein